jgi:hypothetical protein
VAEIILVERETLAMGKLAQRKTEFLPAGSSQAKKTN